MPGAGGCVPAVCVRDVATIFARRLIDALSAGSRLREKTNPDGTVFDRAFLPHF